MQPMAYKLAFDQMKDCDNPDAAYTEENKGWYRNAMRRVLNQDEIYRKDAAKLKRIKHLIMSAVVIVIAYSWLIDPLGATMAGGTK